MTTTGPGREIRKRLRKWREEGDLTLRELVEAAAKQGVSVSISAVSNWETAGQTRVPPGDYLAALCAEFADLNPDWLLAGRGQPSRSMEFELRHDPNYEGGDPHGFALRRRELDSRVYEALLELSPERGAGRYASFAMRSHSLARRFVGAVFPSGAWSYRDSDPPEAFKAYIPTVDQVLTTLQPILGPVATREPYGSEGERMAAILTAFAGAYLREFGSSSTRDLSGSPLRMEDEANG